MIKKPFLLTLIIYLIIILLFTGCTDKSIESLEETVIVELGNIVPMDIFETITIGSRINAKYESKVLVEVPGRVKNVHVKVGDLVEKDGVLITLDTSDIEVQYQQAKAALAAVRAQLSEVQSGARAQDLVQARAALEQADANYQIAKSNLERMEILYPEGMISLRDLEMARGQYASAKAGRETAMATLEKLEEGATEYTIQTIKAQVQQAEAGLRAVERQLEKMTLKSPIDGKVAALMLNVGDLAGGGSLAAIVVKDDPVQVDVYVDENSVSFINTGQSAIVSVPAVNSNHMEFEGIVEFVSPAAVTGSGTYQVRVKIDNCEGYLKPGMFARVTLNTRLWESALMVPVAAVYQRDGREYIYLYDNGVAKGIEVRTGKKHQGLIHVIGDIDDLPVIVKGPRSINSGQPVKPKDNSKK